MKTVLITGATGAVGKATAIALANLNCKLILMARDNPKLEAVKKEINHLHPKTEIEVVIADLSEPDSVRKACESIKQSNQSLNAIVHTAAIFKNKRLENSKGHEYMLATNQLGPFLLTQLLLARLMAGKPSRVITVSAPSFAKIDFDDLHGQKKFSAGFSGAFGISKMMNLMFSYTMARKFGHDGISSIVFHPGLVKSELTREMPAFFYYMFKIMSASPKKAGEALAQLAVGEQYMQANGAFYNAKGKKITSNDYSHDKDLQEKLWSLSEALTTN